MWESVHRVEILRGCEGKEDAMKGEGEGGKRGMC